MAMILAYENNLSPKTMKKVMMNDDVKIDNYKNAIFKKPSLEVAFTTPYQLTPRIVQDLKK